MSAVFAWQRLGGRRSLWGGRLLHHSHRYGHPTGL